MATEDGPKGPRRGAKPVIEHDPLSDMDAAMEGDAETVLQNEASEPKPKRRTVRKKAVAKKKVAKKKVAKKRVAKKKSVSATKSADTKKVDVMDYDIGSSLTILEVVESQKKLTAALDAGGEIALNGGDTQSVDGAGLQMLAAFMRDAVERQVAVTWVASSDSLRRAAAQIGLTEVLGLESAAKVD